MKHSGLDIEVMVDHRETLSEVPSRLARQNGVFLIPSVLRSGDYSIRGEIGIERKTAIDFAKSIIDGRLFPQMAVLRRSYDRPLLLLEGFVPGREITGVGWLELRGALVSVTAVFGVPVLFSRDPEETAELIATTGRQVVQSSDPTSYVRPGYRPKGWRKRALYILQGLPGVGPARAAALLEEFGSVGATLAADEKALGKVQHVGSCVARGIRKAIGEEPVQKGTFLRSVSE